VAEDRQLELAQARVLGSGIVSAALVRRRI
jgi:hypothetical protein